MGVATTDQAAAGGGTAEGLAAAPVGDDESALPPAARSVAGSTVSERARDVLAEGADLVDPEVADPDLVGMDVDGSTRTDLGLPPEPPAPAPEAPDAESPAGPVADTRTADAPSAAASGSAAAAAPTVGLPPYAGRAGDTTEAAAAAPTVGLPPYAGRAGDTTQAPAAAPTVGLPPYAGRAGDTTEAAAAAPTVGLAPLSRAAETGDGTPDGADLPLLTHRTADAEDLDSDDELDDVEPVETDSEATVTLPAGAARQQAPPRSPAYGAYGGADPDLRTQRIAPLPFGSPPAEQQPARAFRPQPPSSPLDFEDERSRGDRRNRSLAALLVVVALVVFVLAGGFVLVRGLRGGDDTGAQGTSPTPSASLGPAPIPTGFKRYTGSGFTVGVPTDWSPREQRDGVVDVREAGSSRFLRLITVDSTTSALDQLSAAEKQFAADPSYGSYHRAKLQKVDYRGLDAADWEFTFTLDGVARHVLYRGIVAQGRTYGLYLSAPADEWAKTRSVFQVATTTFRTS